ncbi:MAG: hypothetical protein WD176_09115, partial [Pirellulales bacterium]
VIFLVGINDVGRDDLNEFDADALASQQSLRNRIVAASELLSTAQVLYRSYRAFDMGVGHIWELHLAQVEKGRVDPAALDTAADDHRKRYVEPFAQRVRSLVELARKCDIEPILMTQPVLYGEYTDPATGVEIGPLLHGDQTAAMRWRCLQVYNDATRRVGGEMGVLVIDLARELPKDSRLFHDWMHYSNAGAERVAGIVADALVPWLKDRGLRIEGRHLSPQSRSLMPRSFHDPFFRA